MTIPTVIVAMAQSGQSGNLLFQLLPLALMLGIFYFVLLLPMKKRQKKVADFQASLKVGDKIITTSGMYGQVTRLGEQAIQVQIADKVRVDIARASIGGFQGQEPVVQESSSNP